MFTINVPEGWSAEFDFGAQPSFSFAAGQQPELAVEVTDGGELAFSTEGDVSLSFALPEQPGFEMEVGTVTYAGVEDYEGEYTSVPCSTAQVYGTSRKRMVEDFTVLEIPIYRADNDDGVTVTIAES